MTESFSSQLPRPAIEPLETTEFSKAIHKFTDHRPESRTLNAAKYVVDFPLELLAGLHDAIIAALNAMDRH